MHQSNAAGQNPAGKLRRKWIVWGVVALAVLVLIVVSIVIPGSLNYGKKARQSGARAGLWAIYKAEEAYYAQHKRYGNFDEIGFKPDSYSRYTFRIDRSGAPGTLREPTGPADHGQSSVVPSDNSLTPAGLSATGFTATAVANIDGDETVDAWHINDSGSPSLQNDVDDVKQ